jgi:hypothetical protein
MSKDKKAPCGFKTAFGGGAIEGLFSESRKKLFLDGHPVSGMKAKDLGIKNGKAFFNLDKQELKFKDGKWEIKAELGKSNVELKNSLDKDTTVTFGVNGVGKDPKVFCGGKGSFGLAAVEAKITSDLAAEVAVKSSVSGLDLGADVVLAGAGLKAGQFGASYALPFGKKTSLGAILSYPSMDAAVCCFGNVPVPGTTSAHVGAEIQLPSGGAPNAVVGGSFGLDKDLSVKTVAGLNGLCHISFIQAFKDVTLTAAVEADLLSGAAPSKFGMEFKMAK